MQVPGDAVLLMHKAIRAAEVRRALAAETRARAEALDLKRESTRPPQAVAQPDPLDAQAAHEAWQAVLGCIEQLASLEPWRLSNDGNFRVPIASPPNLFGGKAAMWIWLRPDRTPCLRFHSGVIAAWGELPRIENESDLLQRLCREDCQWLNQYFRGSEPWADLRMAVGRIENGHSMPWR